MTMRSSRLSSGFMLPLAIFLLVVLAALGGYAMRLSVMTNTVTTQDILSVRAYYAARAGAEWAAMRVLNPSTTSLQNCPTDTMPLSINGFNVTITCQRAIYNEQGSDRNVGVYEIASIARQGTAGSLDYVERELQVTLSRCLESTGNSCS